MSEYTEEDAGYTDLGFSVAEETEATNHTIDTFGVFFDAVSIENLILEAGEFYLWLFSFWTVPVTFISVLVYLIIAHTKQGIGGREPLPHYYIHTTILVVGVSLISVALYYFQTLFVSLIKSSWSLDDYFDVIHAARDSLFDLAYSSAGINILSLTHSAIVQIATAVLLYLSELGVITIVFFMDVAIGLAFLLFFISVAFMMPFALFRGSNAIGGMVHYGLSLLLWVLLDSFLPWIISDLFLEPMQAMIDEFLALPTEEQFGAQSLAANFSLIAVVANISIFFVKIGCPFIACSMVAEYGRIAAIGGTLGAAGTSAVNTQKQALTSSMTGHSGNTLSGAVGAKGGGLVKSVTSGAYSAIAKQLKGQGSDGSSSPNLPSSGSPGPSSKGGSPNNRTSVQKQARRGVMANKGRTAKNKP